MTFELSYEEKNKKVDNDNKKKSSGKEFVEQLEKKIEKEKGDKKEGCEKKCDNAKRNLDDNDECAENCDGFKLLILKLKKILKN